MTKKYMGDNRLLAGICLAVSTYWVFTTATGATLPAIAKTLQTTESALTTPVSLAGLLSGSLIVVSGRMADQYGRKRLASIGLLVNVIACLCLISFSSIWWFSAGRLLQGISAALIMPSTLSMIQVFYQDRAKERAISFWSIASWGGSGISNLFAGAVTTYLSWQAYFVLSILLSVVAYLLIRPAPESSAKQKVAHLDLVGVFLLISDLICLNVLITHLADLKALHPLALGGLGYVIVSTVLLLKKEKRMGGDAILDLTLFKSKLFSISTISNFFLNFTAGCSFIYMLFLQNGFHLSPIKASLFTVGYLITVVIFVRMGERIMIDLKSARIPMIGGTFFAFIGIFTVSLTGLSQNTYLTVSFIGLAIMGVGLGLYATPSTSSALEELDVNKSATGSGIYKMASSLGGSFGVAVGGSIYALNTSIGYAKAAEYALFVMAISALLAMIIVFIFLPKTTKSYS